MAMTAEQLDAEIRRIRFWGKVGSLVLLLALVAATVGGFLFVNEQNAGGFLEKFHQILDFPSQALSEAWTNRAQMLPHTAADGDPHPGFLAEYFPDLIETINIAAVSTLFGGIGGLLLSLLATRGFGPAWIVGPTRRYLEVLRAFPEIVVALVLIYVLGGGPVPAMIAISLHTVGAIGKLYSEVNENADMKPVEGMASVGAGWLQRMWFGVISQVSPNYLSYALLRFEINIRASAILGFVGAGGIGYELKNAVTFGMGRFDEAVAIFILLFVTIVVVDQIGSAIRARLTQGATLSGRATG